MPLPAIKFVALEQIFPVVTSKIATLYINIYFTFIIYELWYFSSVKSSFSPVTFSNNRYNEGKTIRVKNVATNNPPITTVARDVVLLHLRHYL